MLIITTGILSIDEHPEGIRVHEEYLLNNWCA